MVAAFPDSLTAEEAVRIRVQLMRFLRRCRAQEPEEIAQETLLRILINLRAGLRLHSPVAYAQKTAERVLQEDRRIRRRETPLEFDIIAPAPDEHEEALLQCIEFCQRQCFSRSERRLLKRFDEADAKDRQRLAQREGLTRNALGIKVYQLRSKLRTCVENCMKEGVLQK